MTLAEIERVLSERGLRLRKCVRPPKARRWSVTVADESTGVCFDATGIEIKDAIDSAVAAAMRRPVKRSRRRFVS